MDMYCIYVYMYTNEEGAHVHMHAKIISKGLRHSMALNSAPVCLASPRPVPSHPILIPASPYDLTPQLKLGYTRVPGRYMNYLNLPLEHARRSWWKTSQCARLSDVPIRFLPPVPSLTSSSPCVVTSRNQKARTRSATSNLCLLSLTPKCFFIYCGT